MSSVRSMNGASIVRLLSMLEERIHLRHRQQQSVAAALSSTSLHHRQHHYAHSHGHTHSDSGSGNGKGIASAAYGALLNFDSAYDDVTNIDNNTNSTNDDDNDTNDMTMAANKRMASYLFCLRQCRLFDRANALQLLSDPLVSSTTNVAMLPTGDKRGRYLFSCQRSLQ
jgi:hypothetical protein